MTWFERALAGGNLNFLRVSLAALLEARDLRVRAMSEAWQARIHTLQSSPVQNR